MRKDCIFLMWFLLFLFSAGVNAKEKWDLKAETTPKNHKEEPPHSPLNISFDVTSNYVFRGISQTANLPAFQGSFTYKFLRSGMYFTIWGSNIKQTAPNGAEATVEIDTTAGIANQMNEHWKYDLFYIHSHYPSASQLNYDEMTGILTYRFLIGTVAYSLNELGTHAKGWYYNLGFNLPLPTYYNVLTNTNLLIAAGHYSLARVTGKSYNDYSVAISKTISQFNFALQWTDTNRRYTHNSLDSTHLFATVTVNWI